MPSGRRIAVDCRPLHYLPFAGIARFSSELIGEMIRQGSGKWILIDRPPCVPFDMKNCSTLALDLPFSDHRLASRMLSLHLDLENSAALFSPYFPVPVRRATPAIQMILDLIPIVRPDYAANRAAVDLFDGPLRESAHSAERIFTISDSSRQQIVREYGIQSSRIRVIPCGVPTGFGIEEDRDTADREILNRLGLQEEFLLSVGTLEPRKNIARLVTAFGKLGRSLGPKRLELIVVGAEGWKSDQLVSEFSGGEERPAVRWLGFLPDRELAALYRKALAFIYPSLAEGFGLPLLEAMACGCPVITSQTSSMPEVCGDAAVYCRPEDTCSIRDSMEKVITSPQLRSELRQLGLERVRRFTWTQAANTILQELAGLTCDKE